MNCSESAIEQFTDTNRVLRVETLQTALLYTTLINVGFYLSG